MLLRQVTKHIKDQNWFAVFLDFFIVVIGVFVGLQVQEWAQEKSRQNSEHNYLIRLHTEVQELTKSRLHYDTTRPNYIKQISESAKTLANNSENIELTELNCDAIVAMSYTTVPPADLPTANELISAGRLDQILSLNIRQAILDFIQQAARADTLILAMSDSNSELATNHPKLITLRYTLEEDVPDSVWLDPKCDTQAMRDNAGFMNEFSQNAYIYKVYYDRAVKPVSRLLIDLHTELDKTLGIQHTTPEVTP